MLKLLISLFVLVSSLFSQPPISQATKQGAEAYLVNSSNVIEKSCSYTCRPVLSDYVARLRSVDVKDGVISCYIYTKEDYQLPIFTDTYVNEQCAKDYANMTSVTYSSVSDNNFRGRLSGLSNKYFRDYGNTGSQTYLTVPEYVISTITADPNVIDIKATIQTNKIVTKPDYTIFPNDVKAADDNFFKSMLNKASSWYGSLTAASETNKAEAQTHFVSVVDSALTTSSIMFLDFLAESNGVMQYLNQMIVFALFPFSLIMYMGTMGTKKASGVTNHQDNFGIAVGAIFAFVVFYYMPINTKLGYTDNQGDPTEVSQSYYQTWSRDGIMFGTKVANMLTNAYAKVFINSLARDAAVNPTQTTQDIEARIKGLRFELGKYKGLVRKCSSSYNEEALFAALTEAKIYGLKYPLTETDESVDKSLPEEEQEQTKIDYYGIGLAGGLRTVSNIPSISSCNTFARREFEVSEQIKYLQSEKIRISNAIASGLDTRILQIAEVTFKTTAEFGFFAAPMITSSQLAMESVDDFRNPNNLNAEDIAEKVEKATENNLEFGTTDALEEVSKAVKNSALTRYVVKGIAYNAMPMFSTVHSFFQGMAGVGSEQNKKTTTKSGYLIKTVMKFIPAGRAYNLIEIAINYGLKALAFAVTVYFYDMILEMLPVMSIILAGSFAILYYLVSVIVHYFVSPYMAAWAMANQQSSNLLNFMGKAVVLTMKPTILVFSVIIASYASYLVGSMNTLMITKNFASIFAVNELGMFDSLTLSLFEQYLLLLIKVIMPIVLFILVMFGSNIIMAMFGYNDSSDVGQQVNGAMSSKTDNYSLPV